MLEKIKESNLSTFLKLFCLCSDSPFCIQLCISPRIMFSILRIWTIICIVATLKPTLIDSLPQNVPESIDTSLISGQPNQDRSSISTVADTDAFDNNDDDTKETSSVSNDAELIDPILATNTDTSDANENEPIAENSGGSIAPCQSRNDHKTGTLNGRDDEPVCASDLKPQYLTKPPNMTTKEWFRKLFKKILPRPRENPGDEPNPRDRKPPMKKGDICPDEYRYHLCGYGPETDTGRIDIPGWVHRTAVSNLFRKCPTIT